MNTLTKIGLILILIAILLYAALVFVLVMFAIGGAANPPIPNPLGQIIMFFIEFVAAAFYPMLIAGIILIVVGLLNRKKPSSKGPTKNSLW